MGGEFGLDEKQFADVMESYEKSTFYPEDILRECPKFRILVIGPAGAGKSTLCSKVFNVDAKNGGKVRNLEAKGLKISAHGRGTQSDQVWKEITFDDEDGGPENKGIILHDSGGFEPQGDQFDQVKKFIEDRLSKTTLAEQLHCIWYCIPLTSNRQKQSSEERFFREIDVGDIPVIIVFTKFDVIADDHEFALIKKFRRENPRTVLPQELPQTAHALAVRDYDEIYRPPLEELAGSKVAIRRVAMPEDDPDGYQGVEELIRATYDRLTKDGSLRRLWTSAQQQDADLKREDSIEIALQYLSTVTLTSSLPVLSFLSGGMFQSAFNKILGLVSNQWQLLDPDKELQQASTRRRLFEGCLKLSSAGRIGIKIGMSLNPLGFITAPAITVSLLRCAMGLILMHEDLFWKQRGQAGLRLTAESIKQVASDFAESKGRKAAAAYIDSEIDILNYRSKKQWEEVITTSLRLARGEEVWQKQNSAGGAARKISKAAGFGRK